jgi:hypothetical protein
MLKILIQDNIDLLRQGANVIENIPDDLYARGITPLYGSGCGRHIRHIIDHYDRFFAGLPDGRIDYDLRSREERIETDRLYAIDRLGHFIKYLSEGVDSDDRLDMVQNYDPALPVRPSVSSVSRELRFLLGHTVHHFALIRLILNLEGIALPEEFGVAPSTLYHLAAKG